MDNIFFKNLLATDFTNAQSTKKFLNDFWPTEGQVTSNFHSYYFLMLCEKTVHEDKLSELKSQYSQKNANEVHTKIVMEAATNFNSTLSKVKHYLEYFRIHNYHWDDGESFDLLKEVSDAISEITYTPRVYDVNSQTTTYRVKLLPEFFTIESYFYYMFMRFLESDDSLVKCTICKQYIIEPTSHELANYRRYGVITHPGECRKKKDAIKDNTRNKRKYWSEKVKKINNYGE